MSNPFFIHAIVSVNRQDLLQKAVESVHYLWSQTVILDNSITGMAAGPKWPVPVIRPSVPLSTSQSMNFLFRRAKEMGALAFGYQHEDAEAHPETAEKLMLAIESTLFDKSRKWATLLTRYDILSAYYTPAVEDIGEWDTYFPNPNYHIDVDWFYRAGLKGYEVIKTGLPVNHLEGGSVTYKNPARRRVHGITFPMNEVYYRSKWGGSTHKETYITPWNEPPTASN